jgi:hypothetical protein
VKESLNADGRTDPGGGRANLSHVLWMGGSPCSGKSSMAEILAERYQLRTYHVDDAFHQHKDRFNPQEHPTLYKWTDLPWSELWMQPPDILLDEAISAYREHFRFILEDLLNLPKSDPILAEGTALLPDCVTDLLQSRHQALWAVPSAVFQRTRYPQRGDWVHWILRQCDDPDRALRNWMDRDVSFAQWVTERTQALDLDVMVVDGQDSIIENAAVAAAHYRLREAG